MVKDDFRSAFANLLARWKSHQDASRHINDVVALAESRQNLDEARHTVRTARHNLVRSVPGPDRPFVKFSVDEEDLARVHIRASMHGSQLRSA